VNSPSGETDFATSITALSEELPDCGSVSLVVSWFGNDLRCADCEVRPLWEQQEVDGDTMPWRVADTSRGAGGAGAASGRPAVYGGTPSDASVIESIRGLKDKGFAPMFYPFILNGADAGNTLPNPWTGMLASQSCHGGAG